MSDDLSKKFLRRAFVKTVLRRTFALITIAGLIYGFTAMGAEVYVTGPPTMIPVGIEKMGAKVEPSFEAALDGADIIIMLRIQLERKSGALIPSLREYARFFGLNAQRLDEQLTGVVSDPDLNGYAFHAH